MYLLGRLGQEVLRAQNGRIAGRWPALRGEHTNRQVSKTRRSQESEGARKVSLHEPWMSALAVAVNRGSRLDRYGTLADLSISMIPSAVSVLRSRAPVYPMHDEEVGLIEGKESGSLLIRQRTSGRSLRSTFLSLRFVPRLDGMRVDDRPN